MHLNIHTHRWRNDFQSGGAKIFGSKKWHVSAGRRACAMQRGGEGWCAPLRSWSFFENVGLNEAIWCTIFHHVKNLTACLLGHFFYFTTGRAKKWTGHCPPPPVLLPMFTPPYGTLFQNLPQGVYAFKWSSPNVSDNGVFFFFFR